MASLPWWWQGFCCMFLGPVVVGWFIGRSLTRWVLTPWWDRRERRRLALAAMKAIYAGCVSSPGSDRVVISVSTESWKALESAVLAAEARRG